MLRSGARRDVAQHRVAVAADDAIALLLRYGGCGVAQVTSQDAARQLYVRPRCDEHIDVTEDRISVGVNLGEDALGL
jgi:hypothetical protein